MKKRILIVKLILITAAAFPSCSFETSMCPSYGGTKRMTTHGRKAQAHYTKHVRKAI